MKKWRLGLLPVLSLVGLCAAAHAHVQTSKRKLPVTEGRDVLANDPDVFLPITPDSELGHQTRDQNLAMAQIDGKIYWEAWNCKGKACDDAEKAKIRAKAKLVPRTKENWGLLYKPAS